MAGRGGSRPGAGRKRTSTPAVVQQSAAVEVLGRLSELGIPGVKTEADYILHCMKTMKGAAIPLFCDVRNRAHGKPAQAVIAEGKLVLEVVEIKSADHSSAETGETSQIM